MWFTEIAESFTCIVWTIGIDCIAYPLFIDTGEGRTDNGLRRGDADEVGAPELLDRVKFIDMSVPVPPSRMLFRAFSL